MNKFRNRFTIALAIMIVVVLFGVIYLLGELFKSFYINSYTDRIEKEAKLVATLVREDNAEEQLSEKLKTIGKELDATIILTGREGEVRAVSDGSQTAIDQMLEIPEYVELFKYGNVRHSSFSVVNEENGGFYFTYPMLVDERLEGYVILVMSVDSLENLTDKIWGILITSISLGFLIIFTLGYRITNQYTKPIESATRVANELAKGNYSARTYEDRVRETGMLSQSINILARNLQQMTRQQEMQKDRLKALIENMGSALLLIDERGYVGLVNRSYKDMFQVDPANILYHLYYEVIPFKEVIDIVEEIFLTETKVQKHLRVPLKIERKDFEVYGAPIIGKNEEWKGVLLVFHDITDLIRLEQMRKDFVANVSHELKTPVTSIKGFSETLLDGAMKDKELCEYFLNIILKESDRLQSLIQDLLDLSKIEQEHFHLNFAEVQLHELLDEVLVMLESKAESKELELVSAIDGEVSLRGDAHRLKQIFINLVNNAIAYTPSDGKVTLGMEEKEDEVDVFVTDTGIGISEEEIPRIFERFYRVDKARSRNSGGTGLGLAIVKHLVEAHKGKIDVKSKKDEGTTFTVTLKK